MADRLYIRTIVEFAAEDLPGAFELPDWDHSTQWMESGHLHGRLIKHEGGVIDEAESVAAQIESLPELGTAVFSPAVVAYADLAWYFSGPRDLTLPESTVRLLARRRLGFGVELYFGGIVAGEQLEEWAGEWMCALHVRESDDLSPPAGRAPVWQSPSFTTLTLCGEGTQSAVLGAIASRETRTHCTIEYRCIRAESGFGGLLSKALVQSLADRNASIVITLETG